MPDINLVQIITIIIAASVAIIGHEIAHGAMALKFGDETAKFQGRLSINPIKHIDPLGTIIVPTLLYLSTGFVIGWAKPVEVNMHRVLSNKGYLGGILVALAGIFYNLAIVLVCFLALKFEVLPAPVDSFFFVLMAINFILAFFNLYPLPPLDGSKALEYLLRMLNLHSVANLIARSQRYAMIILIIIVISPISKYVFAPIWYGLNALKLAI